MQTVQELVCTGAVMGSMVAVRAPAHRQAQRQGRCTIWYSMNGQSRRQPLEGSHSGTICKCKGGAAAVAGSEPQDTERNGASLEQANLAVHPVGHAAMPRNAVPKVLDFEASLETGRKEASKGRND